MKIQSISELETLTEQQSTIQQLSNTTNFGEVLLEASVKKRNEPGYWSYKMQLPNLLKTIALELQRLESRIDEAMFKIKEISGSYLPLAGGELYGDLRLNSCKLSAVNGSIFINNIKDDAKFLEFYKNSDKKMQVDENGQLECIEDINGCALTAKWSV